MNIKTLFHSKTTLAKNRDIKWIVIHYTAGTTSGTNAALNTANYFKTSSSQGSADYVVDDNEIYLCNPDIRNRYSWAVGGNKYSSMSTSQGGIYYGKCTNKNSISIEICSNKINKSTLFATDTDWYFTDNSLILAAALVKKIMLEFSIDIGHVIMHHHVTGKICPNPFCVNENAIYKWNEFKMLILENSINESNFPISVSEGSFIGETTANLNIRKYADSSSDKIGMINKGYEINIIRKYSDNWYAVNYNNSVTYACSDYIELPVTDFNVRTAINKLILFECSNSKDYWIKHYKDLKYLDLLFININI